MITEERICPICGDSYIATSKCRNTLRKTCGKTECAHKLKKINTYKTNSPELNGIDLKNLVIDGINKIDCPYVCPRTIIENNKTLTDNQNTKGLRKRIANVLVYQLGYKKISKKYYIKR